MFRNGFITKEKKNKTIKYNRVSRKLNLVSRMFVCGLIEINECAEGRSDQTSKYNVPMKLISVFHTTNVAFESFLLLT